MTNGVLWIEAEKLPQKPHPLVRQFPSASFLPGGVKTEEFVLDGTNLTNFWVHRNLQNQGSLCQIPGLSAAPPQGLALLLAASWDPWS